MEVQFFSVPVTPPPGSPPSASIVNPFTGGDAINSVTVQDARRAVIYV